MSALSTPPRVSGAAELLDDPATPADLRTGSLRDLERINRVLLGTRLTLRAVARLVGDRAAGSEVRLLDAGCGDGAMAAALAGWARSRGLRPHVLAVDASEEIAARARARSTPDVEVLVGDVRALDLPDGAVDVAACSLLLHHLEPADAVAALRDLRRVSTRGVVVNDLVRTQVGLLGARTVIPVLTRNPVTRHDAVVSVQRAYTRGELAALLGEAGMRPLFSRSALGYRVVVAAR